jgi:Domain of unknown function (DUF4283)
MPQTSNLATRLFLLWMCLLWTLRNCGNLGVKLLSSRFLGAVSPFKSWSNVFETFVNWSGTVRLLIRRVAFFSLVFTPNVITFMYNGPWVILGHYLTLTKWRPNFRPSLEKVSSTLVWIRFPEVPIEFFEESVLLKMGNLVGRAVKVDDTTMEVSRGRFARVCVEIDLSNKFLEFFGLFTTGGI